jgi:hypothetical protein
MKKSQRPLKELLTAMAFSAVHVLLMGTVILLGSLVCRMVAALP